MIRRPPRSTPKPSSAASDVYKRQVGAVRDIDADCLARCLAGMIDKQPVALIATESFAQNYSSYLERVMDAGTFLQACQRADNGAQWVSLLGFPKIS